MVNKSSGQVEIISADNDSTFLYTHYLADSLVNIVYQSLKLGLRWDDADYLARIIFCRMVPPDQLLNDKGFGIGVRQYGDINLLITLDCRDQTITVISSLIKNKQKISMTFTEFLNLNNNSLSDDNHSVIV
jgi:hypothetical protein